MNVGLEGHFPFLVGDVADVLECRLMRRVVNEDIDAAEFVDGYCTRGSRDSFVQGANRDDVGRSFTLFEERSINFEIVV
jgi:hypothetical protein